MRIGIIALTTFVASNLIVSCGSARSVDNYCKTFYGEGKRLHKSFAEVSASGDPITNFSELLQAPSQMADFYDKLEAVAPNDIEPDVAAMRDAFDTIAKQFDNTSDTKSFIAGAAKGMLAGLRVHNSERRVNAYTLQNCGPPPGTRINTPVNTATPGTTGSEASELTPMDIAKAISSHSITSDQPTSIEFMNSGLSSVNVYWINYTGDRVWYFQLQPGGDHLQQTYVTHPWVVVDSTGEDVAYYLPNPQPSRAVIRK